MAWRDKARAFAAGGSAVVGATELQRLLVLTDQLPKLAGDLVPTATHVIEYKAKETGTKVLNGKVGSELSTSNYGAKEWWLLLEPMAA